MINLNKSLIMIYRQFGYTVEELTEGMKLVIKLGFTIEDTRRDLGDEKDNSDEDKD